MKSMDKISTGIAYGTSAGSAGYWFLQLLDRVTPSQWAAIGVLGSLVFGLLTYLTNLYFIDWPPESPDNQYHLNK
ncbi:class II holin family protein [Escherichia coli]|uniref:class II holin family protein n=1 Tax=Escherichia coli TaxID=562 RepID=UPI000BDEE3BA|nr:class II holin family protein [Escherichia coli]